MQQELERMRDKNDKHQVGLFYSIAGIVIESNSTQHCYLNLNDSKILVNCNSFFLKCNDGPHSGLSAFYKKTISIYLNLTLSNVLLGLMLAVRNGPTYRLVPTAISNFI